MAKRIWVSLNPCPLKGNLGGDYLIVFYYDSILLVNKFLIEFKSPFRDLGFMGFTLAITGRHNVGKSTFFNRLLEQRKAIVDDVSGVTRDRQYGIADWNGKTFNVIDTGGFVPNSQDIFESEIRKQVLIAIQEANALIFMVDTATGITDLDEAMADVLRRTT